MNKLVKLITFHASHNFGSVMQAFALKRAIEYLGNECTIVNFRPFSQLDKYSVFPKTYGVKYLAKSVAQTVAHPWHRMRTFRQYERFISQYLVNNPMISTMEGLRQLDGDVLLTGSDQVWGYQIPEFVKSREDIRPAYYFSFSEGRKISYAASTGTATFEQLRPYSRFMSLYDRISVRESEAVEMVSQLSGKRAECVLDPTFLLCEDDYRRIVVDSMSGSRLPQFGYVLIYSLQGFRARSGWLSLVRSLEDELGLPVVSASHFVPLRGAGIMPTFDIGPTDVLGLFANASYILTDTYHGTLFSTHFRKQFMTYLPGRSDPRIDDIARRLGLSDRIVHNVEDAVRTAKVRVDYELVETLRAKELETSMAFLESAICG